MTDTDEVTVELSEGDLFWINHAIKDEDITIDEWIKKTLGKALNVWVAANIQIKEGTHSELQQITVLSDVPVEELSPTLLSGNLAKVQASGGFKVYQDNNNKPDYIKDDLDERDFMMTLSKYIISDALQATQVAEEYARKMLELPEALAYYRKIPTGAPITEHYFKIEGW